MCKIFCVTHSWMGKKKFFLGFAKMEQGDKQEDNEQGDGNEEDSQEGEDCHHHHYHHHNHLHKNK